MHSENSDIVQFLKKKNVKTQVISKTKQSQIDEIRKGILDEYEDDDMTVLEEKLQQMQELNDQQKQNEKGGQIDEEEIRNISPWSFNMEPVNDPTE